jgi:hypothetical protein
MFVTDLVLPFDVLFDLKAEEFAAFAIELAAFAIAFAATLAATAAWLAALAIAFAATLIAFAAALLLFTAELFEVFNRVSPLRAELLDFAMKTTPALKAKKTSDTTPRIGSQLRLEGSETFCWCGIRVRVTWAS